ncbi:hypothetical protein GQ54DRAFT_339333 [Martensiomyces pterosporus]|nr:hypothetical protein GQ54DRAFT_339333 [Martensiomyces pterosporus]
MACTQLSAIVRASTAHSHRFTPRASSARAEGWPLHACAALLIQQCPFCSPCLSPAFSLSRTRLLSLPEPARLLIALSITPASFLPFSLAVTTSALLALISTSPPNQPAMALKPDISHSADASTDIVSNTAAAAAATATAAAEAEAVATVQLVSGEGISPALEMQQTASDATVSSAASSCVAASSTMASGLLPATLTPTHYDIHLHPSIEAGKFSGSVSIAVKVNQPTSAITLHSMDICIEQATVLSPTGKTLAAVTCDGISYDTQMETATIRLPVTLDPLCHSAGVVVIIVYTGVLGDSMYGMYRCRYRDRSGKPSYMIVTQFQAKCARLAFPCWDEPGIKAEFTLSLTVPSNFVTLSNMPEAYAAEHGKLKTVRFERTPRMSTYLLAIVAGELDYIEATALSGPRDESGNPAPVKCRIYTPPADVDKVQFSLDTAVQVLEKLVDMFAYPYPLPKLDLVAVPELEAGGMENWGLVLFRTVRLYITSQTSLWIRQKAVYVIAHELSHQWFGNLVTMSWWDDLWLNEGFATWIGIYITDSLYPEWHRWDHFAIEDRQSALNADSLRSSHPIKVTIKGSADIDQVFDSITYYKGCSLIRMLSAHLGIDTFMSGVQAYLVTHQYGTATTEDLWCALEEASGLDITALMSSWTTMVGYPVVTVDEQLESGQIHVRQNRYLYSGKADASEDSVTWWVPLAIASSTTSDEAAISHAILDTRKGTFAIPGGTGAKWFKLNYDNAGLYRVCYSPQALRRLAVAIKSGELRTVDVVGILTDMIALVTSGFAKTSDLLDMMDAFQSVNQYVVWQIISLYMESMYLTWADESEPLRRRMLAFARAMFSPLAASLGWSHRPDDGPLVARLRAISIPRSGWSGDTAVISEACRLFDEFYSCPDDKPFHHDFTSSVFEIAVRSGPPCNYARVREMYEHCDRWHLSEDHRMAALGALACTADPDRMWETLEYAMTDRVYPQDLNIVIGFMVTANFHSKHVVWRWFITNYQRIVSRLGECSALLGYVVKTAIGDFSTFEMADTIEEWFCDKHTAVFDRTLPQALEFIRIRAAWFERDKDDVIQWFEQNVPLD